MQKRRTVVLVAIFICVATVVVGIVLAIHFFSNKTESYRSILVYELEGSAVIEREGIEAINAVENLYLESGDRVKTAADSYMRLKLDDDKYIMVEEESVFHIKATGNKVDSKTSIYLEQGTITNEIQNKLSDKSSYEVTTPNSVMAVRGTIFRVEVYLDKNGDVYTKVSVFEGEVTVHLVYPDGTTGEEVLIEAGKEIVIHSNEKITEYLGNPSSINYQDFSPRTLYSLCELMANGASIAGTSREELEKLIQNMLNVDDYGNDSEANTKSDMESDTKSDTKPDTEPDTKSDTESDTKSDTEPDTKSDMEPDTKSDTESDTKSDTESDTKSDTESDTESDEEPVTKPEPETAEHTVTFMYKSKVFGTQKVENGQKVMRPKLNPSYEGNWDFDFSKVIEEDIVIEWK